MNDLRESIIHGLRSKGWSKMDAEEEADERLARRCPHGEPLNGCRDCDREHREATA